ncbi:MULTISPECIES: rhomboid family intramembrane serine protease [Dermacoccus]|uniref:rhomboid family intramembrane serine protease n=1 Tax=Dermacoccus TaxID=57495 RepID=UPI0007814952|nr:MULTISPECIES: rhomboid family intramembrane serine protease [Dermacoccus]
MDLDHTLRPAAERVKQSAVVSALIVAALWIIEALDVLTHHAIDAAASLKAWEVSDLWSIFTMPFAHYGWAHLEANSALLLPLGFVLALSGLAVLARVTFIVTCTSGLAAWLLSPPYTAVAGASGVVFGWLTYLIVRGFWTRRWPEVVVGLVLAVVYGSVLWGVLPQSTHVSWQGHLGGAIGGVLAAKLVSDRTASSG